MLGGLTAESMHLMNLRLQFWHVFWCIFLAHFAANSEDACRKNIPTCTMCRHGDGQDLFEWVVGVDGSGGGSMFIPATAAAD